MPRVQPWTSRLIRGAAFLPVGLAAACSERTSPMLPAGPIAAADRLIMLDALAIMLAIVVPTILATFAFAWWYRADNSRATYRPDFAFSGRLELVVWSIPILTICFLSGLIWIGSHELDPYKRLPAAPGAEPLEVEAVALDWKWLFIYPRYGVASVNQLMLPIGTPVHFRITSASVMNVFFVPRLGTQVYAMNGMATQVSLQADKQGVFYGRSAHFSGDGFPEMSFNTYAVPPARFAAWAAATRGHGPVLTPATYPILARQTRGTVPFNIGTVGPGLFDALVEQTIKPSAGPKEGRGGPGVSPVGGKHPNAR